MKRKSFSKKLNLNKKAIVNLKPSNLLDVKGGGTTATCYGTLCECEQTKSISCDIC